MEGSLQRVRISVKKKFESVVKNYGKANFLYRKLHRLVPSRLERLTPFEMPLACRVYSVHHVRIPRALVLPGVWGIGRWFFGARSAPNGPSNFEVFGLFSQGRGSAFSRDHRGVCHKQKTPHAKRAGFIILGMYLAAHETGKGRCVGRYFSMRGGL